MDAQFLDDLRLILVDDSDTRPQFRLLSSFRFYSAQFARAFTVPVDFMTDGASIPQVAMAVTGWPGLRAAVVHDYLVHAPDIDRSDADLVFREALAVCGVDDFRAGLMYGAVAGYTSSLQPQDPNLHGGA